MLMKKLTIALLLVSTAVFLTMLGVATADTTTTNTTVNTAVTTIPSYIIHPDRQGNQPDLLIGFVPTFFSASDFMGVGSGVYAYMAQISESSSGFTPYLVVYVTIPGQAGITTTISAETSIQENGFWYYIFSLDTTPDWASGAKIVSYMFLSYVITYTDVQGYKNTTTITINDTMHTIFIANRVEYINYTTTNTLIARFIVIPALTMTNSSDTTFSAIYSVIVDGKTFSAIAVGYDKSITQVTTNYIEVNGTLNMSGNGVVVAVMNTAVINITAFDALNYNRISSITVIINTNTYINSVSLLTGTYTVSILASGYSNTQLVITAPDTTTYNIIITLLPTTAIFSISHFSIIKGYEGGIISDIIVLSPRASFTNNVTMQFINFPFTVTAVVDGSTSVLTDNMLFLGAINGEKVITILMSANKTTKASGFVAITANDAFTGTANMSFVEFIAVNTYPFSFTTPNVWVLGTNAVRVVNDTNTVTMTFVVKNEGGTEIYNKIVTLTPLQIYTFSPVIDEGSNTVMINFVYVSGSLLPAQNTGQILFIAEAHKQAEIDSTIITITYDVVNTVTITVTNPFPVVGTYTVFVAGNWDTETDSKIIAVLPNSVLPAEVHFIGPTNKEISAYEVSIWVVYSNATVFSTTIAATATSNPTLFGTGFSEMDLLYIVIGIIAIILLVIAIRRGDEL